MSKYDLDRRAISSIIREKDVRPFIRARITKNYFKSTSSRIAYNWVRQYYDKYNTVPSIGLFREQYPNYELSPSKHNDPPEFIVNALLDRQSFKLLVDGIADAGQELQNNAPRKALSKLTATLEKARLTTDRSYDLSLNDAVKELLPKYMLRKNSPLMAGMPYGFGPLDESTDGMLPQQLGLIYGGSGVGKSWLACIIAYRAFKAGFKVLHITKENSDIEIASRLTALQCNVSPFRLRKGDLTPWEEKKLGRLSHRLLNFGERYIISSQDEIDNADSGSEGVRQKIIQYHPDLVIVDGLYLLQDDDLTGPEWQTLRKMSYRLKNIARKQNVHILAVTQATTGEPGAQDSIGFSKGIGTACDNIINVYTNEEIESMNCRGVKLLKQREGPQIDFRTTWDFDTTTFNAIDLDEPEAEERAELPV